MALAHLLANGTLADLVLFVSDLDCRRSHCSKKCAVLASNLHSDFNHNDIITTIGGLGLYVLFVLKLHGVLIGVPLIGA